MSAVCNRNVAYLVPYLHPRITGGWDGCNPAEQIVDTCRNEKTTEEIQIVDVLCPNRYGLADSPNEANDVDENSTNVGSIASPMKPKPVVVRRTVSRAIQLLDFVVPLTYEVVVTDDWPGD